MPEQKIPDMARLVSKDKGRHNAYYLFTKEPVAEQVRKLARVIGKATGSRRLEEFGATDF